MLVSQADAGIVFASGAAAVVLGATLLSRVSVEGEAALPLAADERGARQMVAAGFRAITETPGARLVVGLIVAQTFVRGCLNVLIVVAAFRVFDADAQAVGYMTAAIGVGGLLGGSGDDAWRRRLAGAFGLALVFWGCRSR